MPVAILALAGIAIAMVIAFRGFGADDAGASDIQQLREAVARAEAASGAVAARVNGVDVPLSKLEAFAIARNTPGIGEESGVASWSLERFLDELIQIELQVQEAERRGLTPSDAEVAASARQTKDGLLAALESDDDAADALRAMFSELEGTPFHVSVYDTSPVILDSMKRSIAVSNLRTELFAANGNPGSTAERDALVNQMIAELRAPATIEILATFND